MNLPPDHVPAWVDKARLAAEICASQDTIDAWIKQGLLPAGERRGGKTLWRWKDVDLWLARGGPESSVSHPLGEAADRIREATRKAVRR